MKVLVLNCGSSSLKFAVYDNKKLLLSGAAENLEASEGLFKTKLNGKKQLSPLKKPSHLNAIVKIVDFIEKNDLAKGGFDAIGHRVVHGGEKFSKSVLINDEIIDTIKECIPLAPLHNPANLVGIEKAMQCFPGVPQIAVFDTAFHQSLPEEAYLYPIPYELYEKHRIRRYGFHGTSHRFITMQAAKTLNKAENQTNIIIAHLGNGGSATAVKNGKSVDTTMGLTPLEGIVMGTRSGDIDPGIFNFLHQQENMSIDDINEMLNKKSGLLGLSQDTNDMKKLMVKAAANDKNALRATKIYCFVLAKAIGRLTASLDSLDALVFTGGIGENNPTIRKWTMDHLKILGFNIDNLKNENNGANNLGLITTENSTKAYVIPTDEELLIAIDCEEIVK